MIFLDISVGEVLAPSHHSASLSASLPSKIEKVKDSKYAELCASSNAEFFPIAFSSCGQIGEKALSFFKILQKIAIANNRSLFLPSWFASLTAIHARTLHQMSLNWASKYSQSSYRQLCTLNAVQRNYRRIYQNLH